MKNLIVRPKAAKLPEVNTMSASPRRKPDIGFGDDFLYLTPKTEATKIKLKKWGYTKIKDFCKAKETINKMKSPPTHWEKTHMNHII